LPAATPLIFRIAGKQGAAGIHSSEVTRRRCKAEMKEFLAQCRRNFGFGA
jgi:hypothetical protein